MAPPMSAGALLMALTTEGLTVREYKSWRTRNRNSKGAWGPINGVMTHHTVTAAGAVALCYEGYAALPGPLCQGVITKDGVVSLISSGRANHAGLGDGGVLAAVEAESYGDYPPADKVANADGNSHFYGFECENLGNGKDPWPAKQYVAMVKANAAICRYYRWTAKSCIAHKEWQPGKSDPAGIDMAKFRKDIAACLAKPAGKWGGVVTKTVLTLQSLAKRVTTLEAKAK